MPGTFTPRTNDTGITSSPWYYSSGNPFYAAGYGMPNCTAYAYGRYAEARNAWASLPTWDAKDWYDDATSFSRGSVPALGAVACWGQNGSGAVGHVAIVETIYSGNDILISESHSTTGLPFFDTQTLHASSGYMDSIYMGSSFYFQGFIYNDWSPGGGGGTPLPPSSWHAKTTGGYDRTDTEAIENALCAYKYLLTKGWTLNAFCGMWGNVEYESGYNPWRWESDSVPSYPSTPSYGYGLPQFTPSSKYISSPYAQSYTGYSPNWSDHAGTPDDGAAQIQFIDEHADYYPTATYDLSYSVYKISTYSAGLMAKAWLYNYERPADPGATENDRAAAAEYWYDLLIQYDPSARKPWKYLQRKKAKCGYIRRKRLFRY